MWTVRKTTIDYCCVEAGSEYWIFFRLSMLSFISSSICSACYTTAIVEIYSEDQSSSALTEYKEAVQQHRTYLTPLKLLPNTRLLCQKRIFRIEKMIGWCDCFDGIKNVFLFWRWKIQWKYCKIYFPKINQDKTEVKNLKRI